MSGRGLRKTKPQLHFTKVKLPLEIVVLKSECFSELHIIQLVYSIRFIFSKHKH